MQKFEKLNDCEIQIYENPDGSLKFEFDGAWYKLDDFIRVHNNAWFSGDDFPEYIQGMYSEGYFPIFIELIGSDYVNVYEAVNG